MIYLEDQLIFNKMVQEHWIALYTIFACLAKHLLYLRIDKHVLLLKHKEFIGHVLDALGVKIYWNKIDVITK